jgi:hypothetical protein
MNTPAQIAQHALSTSNTTSSLNPSSKSGQKLLTNLIIVVTGWHHLHAAPASLPAAVMLLLPWLSGLHHPQAHCCEHAGLLEG